MSSETLPLTAAHELVRTTFFTYNYHTHSITIFPQVFTLCFVISIANFPFIVCVLLRGFVAKVARAEHCFRLFILPYLSSERETRLVCEMRQSTNYLRDCASKAFPSLPFSDLVIKEGSRGANQERKENGNAPSEKEEEVVWCEERIIRDE